MNWDVLFAVVFYSVLALLFVKFRSRFVVQGKVFVLFKTKLGLVWMEWLASRFPRLLRWVGFVSVAVGFAGMGFILFFLVKGTIELILVPNAVPAVAPVLPGVRVPGLPVLSFWHWIVAIFFVAVGHEFFHGVYSYVYRTRVKSSGFAFLGPILAAFVEPDEKELVKRGTVAQLSVFSAGPFANVVMGGVFLLVFSYLFVPVYGMVFEPDGVVVGKVLEGFPAAESGLKAPFVVRNVNGVGVKGLSGFVNVTSRLKPGEGVELVTDQGEFSLVTVGNPENASRAFMGVSSLDVRMRAREGVVARFGKFLPGAFSWLYMLVFWLFVVNLGVGLFNLLPLGPVDGGRMFFAAAFAWLKDVERAKRVWGMMMYFCLLLIVINLLPYVWKFLVFLAKPLMILLGV